MVTLPILNTFLLLLNTVLIIPMYHNINLFTFGGTRYQMWQISFLKFCKLTLIWTAFFLSKKNPTAFILKITLYK